MAMTQRTPAEAARYALDHLGDLGALQAFALVQVVEDLLAELEGRTVTVTLPEPVNGYLNTEIAANRRGYARAIEFLRVKAATDGPTWASIAAGYLAQSNPYDREDTQP